MIKFDKPIQTKSGMDVSMIWNELQQCWISYKKAKFDRDYLNAHNYALQIQKLQDDIGLQQAKFPELEKSIIR